jgi:hypothetical protein
MAHADTGGRGGAMSTETRNPDAVAGWVLFAGLMMMVIGIFNVVQGLVALFKDEVYAVGASGLIVTTDFTTWGWILIIWGIVMALSALSLMSGNEYGRWFGIVVVSINMIGQFAWFPAYPLWSLVVIGLSAGVLWALTVGWSSMRY